MSTPSWTAVLLGLGPALALVVWGLLAEGRAFARRHALMLAWAAGALAMSRLPLWFQRKLLFGVQIPLALVAGAAVEGIARRDGGGRATAAGLVAIAVALSLPTWGYVAYNTRLSLSPREKNRYYAPRPVWEALEFLARRGNPEEIVFSAVETGGLVVMATGKTAVWGHWAQSVDLKETEDWFEDLLAERDPRRREKMLWERADYVFADGRLKSEIDSGRLRWVRASAPLLFENEAASVYGRPGSPKPLPSPS